MILKKMRKDLLQAMNNNKMLNKNLVKRFSNIILYYK